MTALLAFDTATDRMSVALGLDRRMWTREGAAGAQASLHLLPAVFELLDEASLALRDLDAIGFGRGPGAFTGLRTACSVAQGLAMGAGKPVLSLDSLMASAEDARARQGLAELWVAMDARIDQIYAAQYRWSGDRWHTLDAPALYTLEALNGQWLERAPRGVAGNALTAFGERLRAGSAPRADDALPSSSALLSLAHTAWADGAALDAAQALPLYLRDKVAQTTAERDAARAAASARSASAACGSGPG